MALTKASSTAGGVGGELQVDELVAQKRLRGVSDRAGAGRAQRGGAGRTQAGVGVKFGELALLPAHADDAHRPARFGGIGCNSLCRSRREAGDAVEDVIAPSAPVGGRAHGLAELAVVGNVDAHVFLRAHDFADGRAQPRLQRHFVLRRDGFFRPHGAQVRRPRQAADMGGKNAFSASFHWRLPLARDCSGAEFHNLARMFNCRRSRAWTVRQGRLWGQARIACKMRNLRGTGTFSCLIPSAHSSGEIIDAVCPCQTLSGAVKAGG